MRSGNFAKITAGISVVVVMGVVWMLSSRSRVHAQDDNNQGNNYQVQQGFAIAKQLGIPLNLAGKDPNLVGLGSYLVNAVGDCNGCHSSGSPTSLFIYPYLGNSIPPAPPFAGGNPYFNQREKLDLSVYLNGGTNFGTVGTPTGPNGYTGPAIITRNLTPDYTGKAEGGHSLAEFMDIIKNGKDYDHVHPNCTADQITEINNGGTPICIPTGVIDDTGFNNIPDGKLLQIMPWVTFSHMTDNDIQAMYEYLSSIPCIDNTLVPGPAGDPNELRNQCGPEPIVPAVQAKDDNEGSKAFRSRRMIRMGSGAQ